MWAHAGQSNHIWMSEDFFWDLIFSFHYRFQDCGTNTLPTELPCSGFQNSYLTPQMYPVFMTVLQYFSAPHPFPPLSGPVFFKKKKNMYREHTYFNVIGNSLTPPTWTNCEYLWSFRICIVYIFLKHWQDHTSQKDHTRLGFATNCELFLLPQSPRSSVLHTRLRALRVMRAVLC